MNKTLKILFYLKKRVGYTSGPLPIYLRVTVDSQRMEGASQREIDPDKWDAGKQLARGNTTEARQLNSFLDSLRNQVYEAQRDLLNRGEDITAQGLKTILYGLTESSSRTLCEGYEYVIAQVREPCRTRVRNRYIEKI